MSRLKVLVTDPVDQAFLERVSPYVDVEVSLGLSEEEMLKKVGDVDVLVVRSRTKVTKRVIEAAQRLKAIIRAGVGVDNIDMEAARRRGLVVVNTPREPAVSVAELTMSLALCLARKVSMLDRAMKQGRWMKGELGVELRGKVMGVVGLGSVGSEVARLARAFGMRVVAYDPYVSRDYAERLGVELLSFDEVLSLADFLSIHVPLTPETKGMIGRREIEKMKDGAFIINTSRGEVVDEEALYEALKSGKLAGAGLDVYSKEPPPPDHPLIKLDNVVCTPHIGGSTVEAQLRIAMAMAEDLIRIAKGEEPINRVR
ncbi:MAG: hydroxyacid dehydrogenase [Candidatus Nezhaarchaeales archaeon]